jgi:hypothetical protein
VRLAKPQFLGQSPAGDIDQLVRRIEHVELETFPEFFHCFTEGAQFVPFQTRIKEAII